MLKNSKRKFIRILAMLLALITLISSTPIEAHANTPGSTTDIGGNEGGDSDFKVAAGTNYMGWYNMTQGYRIYIINSSFERISPVYDFSLGRSDINGTGWKNPIKWYATNVNEDNTTEYHWETRFDTENSPTSGNQMLSFEKLQEWCSYTESSLSDLNYSAKLPPVIYEGYYTKNSEGKSVKNYRGNGKAFRDWFFAGQGGTNIQLSNNSGGGVKDNTGKELEKSKEIDDLISDLGNSTPPPTSDPDTCKTCGGTTNTTMPCPNCKGRGQCTVCNNVGLFIIKCPTCNSDEINCNTCKDTKICMTCCGTGRQVYFFLLIF